MTPERAGPAGELDPEVLQDSTRTEVAKEKASK
jgi:hypothetical protein